MPHELQPGAQAKLPPLPEFFLFRLPKPQPTRRHTRALRQSVSASSARIRVPLQGVAGSSRHSTPNNGSFKLPTMLEGKRYASGDAQVVLLLSAQPEPYPQANAGHHQLLSQIFGPSGKGSFEGGFGGAGNGSSSGIGKGSSGGAGPGSGLGGVMGSSIFYPFAMSRAQGNPVKKPPPISGRFPKPLFRRGFRCCRSSFAPVHSRRSL